MSIFPASHYSTPKDKLEKAIKSIEEELERRLEELKRQDKVLEAARLEQRTNATYRNASGNGIL